MTWKPTASIVALKTRALMLQQIRDFFCKKNVLEVETPLMANNIGTDVYLDPIQVTKGHYLQTSPEFAMKRMLAAGIGSIYQICKAFRDGEAGSMHNPEFTMLEWYRLEFDDIALMNEIEELLIKILGCSSALYCSYSDIFHKVLNIDLNSVTIKQLQDILVDINISDVEDLKLHDWLDIAFSRLIQPTLQGDSPYFIYDYPKELAALARVKDGVAKRFEVFYQTVELGNGYYELCDSKEQRARFIKDNQRRELLNKPIIEIDEKLLQALEHGMPECAGVAMGLDRLLMLKLGLKDIREVIAFPIDIA